MERFALSWGKARQFTKLLLSLLSHIGGLESKVPSPKSKVETGKYDRSTS